MRQINFIYNDIHDAKYAIKDISEHLQCISPSNIILHIYVSGLSCQQGSELLEAIDTYLSGIPRIGISEYPAYAEKNNCQIKLNFIIAENSLFYSYQLHCERGCEKDSADTFVNIIKILIILKQLKSVLQINCSIFHFLLKL